MSNDYIIMVVDDQPDFIEGVRLILESEGFDVLTASDGQNALDLLETEFKRRRELRTSGAPGNYKLFPDLILADIMMPVMDGYDLYENVRANPYLNHIPFVFLTAKTDDPDVRLGKEMGADDYLTKPCQPDDLLATIRGKLKRSDQRRSLTAHFTGDTGTPSAVGIFVIFAIIVIIIIITMALTLFFAG